MNDDQLLKVTVWICHRWGTKPGSDRAAQSQTSGVDLS